MHLTLPKTVASLAFCALALTACSSSASKATKSEAKTRDTSYASLTQSEPAHGMTFSPTRKTINKWVDTWNTPGQLAFVYLKDTGKITGYFVFQGPPVSMCAALTPTYKIQYDDHGNLLLPAPGVDGVYYSGGQCNQYYGIDASTGNYVEFSIGGTQNYELTTQPLPSTGDLPTEGFTSIHDLKQVNGKFVAKP